MLTPYQGMALSKALKRYVPEHISVLYKRHLAGPAYTGGGREFHIGPFGLWC